METDTYILKNKQAWEQRTEVHVKSDFYDQDSFMNGKNSLKEIELNLLGDVKGKSILHLQCHFGQDTLSLARMGANVTGIDFSEKAIQEAKKTNEALKLEAQFICCDLYELPTHLDQQFDIVYTSYGTIGWLPDIHRWAQIVSRYLKPEGTFIFVEFHPVLWMFDNAITQVTYNYFHDEAIVEQEEGTYADKEAAIQPETITWNHALSEVMQALLDEKLHLRTFQEFDYSPYNVVPNVEEVEPGKFRAKHIGNKLPLVYALKMVK
jgi:ubiquinone/menaquinone biosynthesis C-methylase UbiE